MKYIFILLITCLSGCESINFVDTHVYQHKSDKGGFGWIYCYEKMQQHEGYRYIGKKSALESGVDIIHCDFS